MSMSSGVAPTEWPGGSLCPSHVYMFSRVRGELGEMMIFGLPDTKFRIK